MENLLRRKKIGYGAGSFIESGFYNFAVTFFLLYLTTVVHLPPKIAGTICSSALLMEGIGGVVAGHISDQTYSRFGKRRPFIIIAGIAGCILLCLFFIDVSSLESVKVAYYFIIAALYWTAYSFFYINHIALGSELSDDYHERISIRSYCRIYSILGNFMGTASSLFLVSLFTRKGLGQQTSWQVVVIIIAIIACTCCTISWRTTRGMEEVYSDESKKLKTKTIIGLFRDYGELIKLKCLGMLILARSLFMVAYAVYTTSLIYYMKFKMNLDNSITSTLFLAGILASIVYLPPLDIMSRKLGKHITFLIVFFLSGISGIVITIFDIVGMGMVFFYVCIFTLAHSCFWQVNTAMLYDISEVDEYKYGKRRQGSILSLTSVIGTCASSVGIFFVGAMLKQSGFVSGASSQSADAIHAIEHIFILYPSIILLCAAAIFGMYPLNKKRFMILKEAITLKKENKSIGTREAEIKKLYWK